MKKALKKITCIALMLSTTFSIMGCGKEPPKTNKLTIAFADTGYGSVWLNEALESFKEANKEKYPDFEYETEGDPMITTKIATRLETNTEITDIIMGLHTNWQMWAIQGYLEDLTDIYQANIPGEQVTMQNKMEDDINEYGKVFDKYYAVPWNNGVSGIVYNAKMFRDNGWEIPTTLDELLALCEDIKTDTNNQVAPFSWGGQVGSYWDYVAVSWWGQVNGTAGIEEFNNYANADVFGQEGREEMLKAWQKLIGNDPSNSIDKAMEKNHISSQMLFIQGKAAMIPNGNWIKSEMKTNASEDFEYLFMPTPFLTEELKQSNEKNFNYTAAGDFMIIPKSANNKTLAKEFLQFLATDDMIQEYFIKSDGGLLPYEYDYEVPQGDAYLANIIDIKSNSHNINLLGKSPMYYKYLVNPSPLWGSVYGILYDASSPEDTMCSASTDLFEQEYNHAKTQWRKWQQLSGIA